MEQGKADRYPESLLTRDVISSAIEVHKVLGPGLLESAYSACLVKELREKNLRCAKEVTLPVEYKGVKLDCGYRLDINGWKIEFSALIKTKQLNSKIFVYLNI